MSRDRAFTNARFLLPCRPQLTESSNLEGTWGEEHCDSEKISAKCAGEESTISSDDQCNGCENALGIIRGYHDPFPP